MQNPELLETAELISSKQAKKAFNILPYLKCKYHEWEPEDGRDYKYYVMKARPCKGVLHVTDDRLDFIRGKIEVQGTKEGRYPKYYLDMIDSVFGEEPNTIEVCSRSVEADNKRTAFTVDLNPDFKPSKIVDGTTLAGIEDNRFNRWRCDPPYNEDTARKMYKTALPKPIRLLKAGARVCKVGSLMFLLLDGQNYQWCPPGVIRVGLIYLSVVPNNETRALNIYYKYADSKQDGYQGTLG